MCFLSEGAPTGRGGSAEKRQRDPFKCSKCLQVMSTDTHYYASTMCQRTNLDSHRSALLLTVEVHTLQWCGQAPKETSGQPLQRQTDLELRRCAQDLLGSLHAIFYNSHINLLRSAVRGSPSRLLPPRRAPGCRRYHRRRSKRCQAGCYSC